MLRTWTFYENGRNLAATAHLDNLDALHGYARQLCQWWADGNDVLVTPTMAEVPPRIGELKGAPVERIVPYTSPFNVSGQPGIALPLYWNDEGLPLGVQLIAAYGRGPARPRRVTARVGRALDRSPPTRLRVTRCVTKRVSLVPLGCNNDIRAAIRECP